MNILTKKDDWLFVVALLFAVWFLATGIFWVYWAALYISFPAGLVAFIIWKNIKKDARPRNNAILVILICGLLISLATLAIIVFNN